MYNKADNNELYMIDKLIYQNRIFNVEKAKSFQHFICITLAIPILKELNLIYLFKYLIRDF
jgi:hypothetical protein